MGLTRYEKMKANEEAERQAYAERLQGAHERHMQQRRNYIETNPNAVSRWEKEATLGRAQKLEDDRGLRAHELEMIGKKGENAAAVERIKSDTAKEAAMIEWESRSGMNAADNATKEKVAEMEQSGMTERNRDTNKSRIDLEVEKGNNAYDTEEKRGENELEVEKEKQRGAERIEKIKERYASEGARLKAEQAAAARSLKGQAEQEKRIDDMVKVLMGKDQYRDMPAGDLRAEAMKRLGIGASALDRFRK